MMKSVKNTKELIEILTLKKISDNLFQGQNAEIGSSNIYGGQVLAQSLSAAYQTIENRIAHSFHGYFLEPGDKQIPIEYEVLIIRDGKSFSLRTVNAYQGDKLIFTSQVSFSIKQDNSLTHQFKKPFMFRVPMISLSTDDLNNYFKFFLPKKLRSFLKIERPVEFKIIELEKIIFSIFKYSPKKKIWFKFKENNCNLDYKIVQQMLLYASDFQLLFTSLEPHPFKNELHAMKNLKMATIDHSIWFHKEFDPTEWLLYDLDSPILHESKGFTRGLMYTKSGLLVASVTQEGLIRRKQKDN